MHRKAAGLLLSLTLPVVLLLAACGAPGSDSGPRMEIRAVLEATGSGGACTVTATASGPDDERRACDPQTGEQLVLGPAEIDGTEVTAAEAVQTPGADDGSWAVTVRLDERGRAALEELSGRLIGYASDDARNRMALLVDGDLVSAPRVAATITDGQVLVVGSFGEQEARELAASLISG